MDGHKAMSTFMNNDLQLTFLSNGAEIRGRIVHLPTGMCVNGRGSHLSALYDRLLSELAEQVTRTVADGNGPIFERSFGQVGPTGPRPLATEPVEDYVLL
jgi:hypothetical protein